MVNNNTIFILILVGVLFFISQQEVDTSSNVDLSSAIDSGVAFRGQNMFVASESTPVESVRILKENGAQKDLGYVSLDAGTLSTEPGHDYKFYYFFNNTPSPNYYVFIEEYETPLQEAVDDRVGYGCTIADSLTYTSYDEYGRPQTSSSNSQSIAASQVKDVSIRLAVAANECYGMPGSPQGNAVCFAYNANAFSKIEPSSNKVTSPISVVNNATGSTVTCYEFDLLEDRGLVEIPIQLTAGSTEPTKVHNITVYTEDSAFDLNAENLDEIFGYQDESGNNLGGSLLEVGTIYVS